MYTIPFSNGSTAHSGTRPPHYRDFTITLRHATLSITPLDEWSVPRRDIYLTTHNNRRRQTSMPQAGFEPAIPGSEGPQTLAIDGAVTIRNNLNHIPHSVTNQNWSPTVQYLISYLSLLDLLTDWLKDWLIDWLIDWLTECLKYVYLQTDTLADTYNYTPTFVTVYTFT
jgi:hypothetical protein